MTIRQPGVLGSSLSFALVHYARTNAVEVKVRDRRLYDVQMCIVHYRLEVRARVSLGLLSNTL